MSNSLIVRPNLTWPPSRELAAGDVTSANLAALLGAFHSKLDALHEKLGTLTRRAAYLEMPPDGIPFNELGWVTIPAIGSTVNVLSFQVIGGMNGAIKWIGNSYVAPGFLEGSGGFVWQILADGQPVRNFEKILGSLGSPTSPSETAPLRIFEQQTISLAVLNVNVAPAGGYLGGRLSGWYYPMEYDSQAASGQEGDEGDSEDLE
jgi:hypothetical protein